jgi:hypothetical protein
MAQRTNKANAVARDSFGIGSAVSTSTTFDESSLLSLGLSSIKRLSTKTQNKKPGRAGLHCPS